EDVKSVIAPALASGPIEITMVGDITVDAAVKSVAATFGALPQRNGKPMPQPAMGDLKFPAPNAEPMKLTHNGRADQSVAFVGWREHGPNADELERARKPEIDALTRAMQTNAFWQSGLGGAQADERRLKLIRDALPQLKNVTAADVQRVAQKYLTDARAFKLM